MTVDEFLIWVEDWPGRYELDGGVVYGMAPERAGHARANFAVQAALRDAIARTRALCRMLPDGTTVRVDATTAYEPDALVHFGDLLPDDAVEVPASVIVVEVLSPGTRYVDPGAEFAGYFALPSIRHCLMVDLKRRVVVLHRREDEVIATRLLGTGPLRLDPPGLDFAVEDLFGEA